MEEQRKIRFKLFGSTGLYVYNRNRSTGFSSSEVFCLLEIYRILKNEIRIDTETYEDILAKMSSNTYQYNGSEEVDEMKTELDWVLTKLCYYATDDVSFIKLSNDFCKLFSLLVDKCGFDFSFKDMTFHMPSDVHVNQLDLTYTPTQTNVAFFGEIRDFLARYNVNDLTYIVLFDYLTDDYLFKFLGEEERKTMYSAYHKEVVRKYTEVFSKDNVLKEAYERFTKDNIYQRISLYVDYSMECIEAGRMLSNAFGVSESYSWKFVVCMLSRLMDYIITETKILTPFKYK